MPARKTDTVVEAPAPNPVPEERVTKPRKIMRRTPPPPKRPPDLVLVRCIEQGQYGLDTDIIIRNPGEVFDMDTSAMRKWPLEEGEHPVEGATIIETERGQFEVPRWVELVEDEDAVTDAERISRGHPKEIRGQVSASGGRTIDVL